MQWRSCEAYLHERSGSEMSNSHSDFPKFIGKKFIKIVLAKLPDVPRSSITQHQKISWGQFQQNSMSSFYARRSQKRKKAA